MTEAKLDAIWVPRIASTVHAIRPDWAEEGIASTLTKLVGRSLAEVTLAATTAALTRPDQRTPAIIALGGAHWATPGQRTEPPPRWTGATCEICGRGREVHNQMNSLVYPKDRHEWMDPIGWNRIESNKAAAPLGARQLATEGTDHE